MTLTQLEYIIALDTYRHFVLASEKCYVTQPTLSMQIQKVEEELGVKIFDRTKQPVIPTEIGTSIIAQARIVLREASMIKQLIAEQKDYEIAREVSLATACNDQMVPLTINQREVLDSIKALGKNIVGENGFEEEVGWTHRDLSGKIPLGSSQLYREINKLVKMGFIEKSLFKFDYDIKKQVVYSYKEQIKIFLPTWEEMMILGGIVTE